MAPMERDESRPTLPEPGPAVACEDCHDVLHADGDGSPSFLLLDELTVPLLSCDAHLERFAAICELTSDDTASLLHHRPAGGVPCPSCQLAPYSPGQAMVPVQDGAIVVLACPNHQTGVIERFHTGLETHQQLTTDLGSHPSL